MGQTKEEPWDLVIGQVTAPFGIQGEVRLRPETDDPDRFRDLRAVCLAWPTGVERTITIERVRVTPKGICVKFTGIATRDDAETLRSAWVKIPRSQARPLPEHSYWIHDLIGLQVRDLQGADLGEITEVIRSAANDVYVTEKVMIPALKKVVRSVDLETRVMVVDWPAEEKG